MSGDAVLLHGVAKQYPGGVHALRSVSLRIGSGEQLAVRRLRRRKIAITTSGADLQDRKERVAPHSCARPSPGPC